MKKLRVSAVLFTLSTILLFSRSLQAQPCQSGVPVGQKVGPYSFLVATGADRGKQTCYVCDTAERPAVVIFSRKMSEPLGKLAAKCDDWVLAQPKDTARSG